MSYKFSKLSLGRLNSCHSDLQVIFNKVITMMDCSILCGHRTKEEQNKAVDEGKSQLLWPFSKHNQKPALAVDVAPYPIDWEDEVRFYYFAGMVMGTARYLKAKGKISHFLRWGGDWNRNDRFDDNKFNDLVHFELVKK